MEWLPGAASVPFVEPRREKELDRKRLEELGRTRLENLPDLR